MATGDYPKRIHLLSSRGDARIEEDRAYAAITPGMLLSTRSDGKVIAHNSAAGAHERKFALEDALQGKTIDQAYAADDLVTSVHAEPGDVVYAFLNAGEHATKDEYLTSAGNGYLKVSTTSADKIVGKALEEVDRTDTETETGRIRVRIV